MNIIENCYLSNFIKLHLIEMKLNFMLLNVIQLFFFYNTIKNIFVVEFHQIIFFINFIKNIYC